MLKKFFIFVLVLIVALGIYFALAANDVFFDNNTDFEILTSDTAEITTITVSTGGQATEFSIDTDFIDITLDNLTSLTINTSGVDRFLKIVKQSGSDDYTISPTCPTSSVVLTGTGATAVLRLEVTTTDNCVSPPPPAPEPEQESGTSSGYLLPKPSLPPPIIFTRFLYLGASGADVYRLQEILQKLGYFRYPLGPTGYFGLVTRQAVVDFQKANITRVFTSPGWVGPYTRGLLNEINIGL